MFALVSAIEPSILAQMGPEVAPSTGTSGITSLLGSAIGAFLTTLIVGAILIAVAPEYTRGRMDDVMKEPVGSFLYGLVSLVLLLIVVVILIVTVIGIFIAIPLAFAAYILWAVGAAIAFLAIGDRLVGHADGWAKPLLVGAAINGALTLTGIGGIITFAIGAAGFGTVLRKII